MDQINGFDGFSIILGSMGDNNEELVQAIEKIVPRKYFVRWFTSPDFGGVYTRPSEEYPGLEEIVFKWGDKEWTMPNVFYKDGDFYFSMREYLPNTENLKGMFKSGDLYYLRDVMHTFVYWLQWMYKKTPIFNPFEHGVENMPIVKELESKGMKIVSGSYERRNGILALRFPDAIYDYIIIPEGDIGRRGYEGFILDIDIDKEELLKGIHKLEDLIPKLMFVSSIYFLDLAKNKGLPEESFKKLLSILGSGDGVDDPSYKEEYDKIVKEYPQGVLYLPEPKGGGNKELIKGAKILGRMRVF